MDADCRLCYKRSAVSEGSILNLDSKRMSSSSCGCGNTCRFLSLSTLSGSVKASATCRKGAEEEEDSESVEQLPAEDVDDFTKSLTCSLVVTMFACLPLGVLAAAFVLQVSWSYNKKGLATLDLVYLVMIISIPLSKSMMYLIGQT